MVCPLTRRLSLSCSSRGVHTAVPTVGHPGGTVAADTLPCLVLPLSFICSSPLPFFFVLPLSFICSSPLPCLVLPLSTTAVSCSSTVFHCSSPLPFLVLPLQEGSWRPGQRRSIRRSSNDCLSAAFPRSSATALVATHRYCSCARAAFLWRRHFISWLRHCICRVLSLCPWRRHCLCFPWCLCRELFQKDFGLWRRLIPLLW